MKNFMKEQVISHVEAYGKTVEREAYDNVLNILHSKISQLDTILDSQEAKNIFSMAMGYRFNRLHEKRRSLRSKTFMVLDILEKVSELRFGKY